MAHYGRPLWIREIKCLLNLIKHPLPFHNISAVSPIPSISQCFVFFLFIIPCLNSKCSRNWKKTFAYVWYMTKNKMWHIWMQACILLTTKMIELCYYMQKTASLWYINTRQTYLLILLFRRHQMNLFIKLQYYWFFGNFLRVYSLCYWQKLKWSSALISVKFNIDGCICRLCYKRVLSIRLLHVCH